MRRSIRNRVRQARRTALCDRQPAGELPGPSADLGAEVGAGEATVTASRRRLWTGSQPGRQGRVKPTLPLKHPWGGHGEKAGLPRLQPVSGRPERGSSRTGTGSQRPRRAFRGQPVGRPSPRRRRRLPPPTLHQPGGLCTPPTHTAPAWRPLHTGSFCQTVAIPALNSSGS